VALHSSKLAEKIAEALIGDCSYGTSAAGGLSRNTLRKGPWRRGGKGKKREWDGIESRGGESKEKIRGS